MDYSVSRLKQFSPPTHHRASRLRGEDSVRNHVKTAGFTLIELLVVMAIIATLLTIAVPRYFGSVDHSKEVALKQSLNVMRDALDKFYGDTGTYPETLDDLVTKKYLRKIPVDPITDSVTTWQIISPPDGKLSGVYNIKSGASGTARDSSNYQDW